MTIRLDVAFLPVEVREPAATVAIVVDVIRASTSMVTLFERGCPRIHVARTLEQGRSFARSHGLLLCGERDGARPEGFDFGNSPSEFAQQAFAGRAAVLCTTNGTVALHTVAASPAVFVGCLANASAVAAEAAAAAAVGALTIVCAGSHGYLAFDDAWTAGRLVEKVAALLGDAAVLTDAARMALCVTRALPDGLAALQSSRSARALTPLGLTGDVDYAAREDRSTAVPRLVAAADAAPYPLLLVPDAAGAVPAPAVAVQEPGDA